MDHLKNAKELRLVTRRDDLMSDMYSCRTWADPRFIKNPCSGLRSLLALLATAAAFAWFQPGGVWRRLGLLLSGVPIAVAGNALRITALILVAHYGSVRLATGRFHDWSGYFVYAGALAALFGMRTLLTPRRPPAPQEGT